jgi:hypothetical protein
MWGDYWFLDALESVDRWLRATDGLPGTAA